MSITATGSAGEIPVTDVDVVVIGAGQAGLSSAYFVCRFGLGFVVVDSETGPGGAWRHRSPTLTMEKIHDIFDLPGMHRAPEIDPDRQAAEVAPEYFAAYERVLRPVKVRSVTYGDRLLVTAAPDGNASQVWTARVVVNATGTWTRPPLLALLPRRRRLPGQATALRRLPGTRRVRRQAGGRRGRRGLGHPVAGVAAETLWVTRRPPVFNDGGFDEEARREAVARVEARVRAGLPPQSVVGATGLGYTTVVRQAMAKGALDRLPMFDRITPYGVAWNDGREADVDVIVWATGGLSPRASTTGLDRGRHLES
jgi:glycine/D-amino acid oxidase-like deaminating enzyme